MDAMAITACIVYAAGYICLCILVGGMRTPVLQRAHTPLWKMLLDGWFAIGYATVAVTALGMIVILVVKLWMWIWGRW